VEAAIDHGGDRIVTLTKEYSVEKVEALLKLQLIELNDILDLKRPLSELAIDTIAEELVANYGNMTMADIYLVFRRAKLGHYGELYESINVPKVMRWFEAYFGERCEACAARSIKEASSYRSPSKRMSDNTDRDRKAYKEASLRYRLEKLGKELKNK